MIFKRIPNYLKILFLLFYFLKNKRIFTFTNESLQAFRSFVPRGLSPLAQNLTPIHEVLLGAVFAHVSQTAHHKIVLIIAHIKRWILLLLLLLLLFIRILHCVFLMLDCVLLAHELGRGEYAQETELIGIQGNGCCLAWA